MKQQRYFSESDGNCDYPLSPFDVVGNSEEVRADIVSVRIFENHFIFRFEVSSHSHAVPGYQLASSFKIEVGVFAPDNITIGELRSKAKAGLQEILKDLGAASIAWTGQLEPRA